MRKEQHIKLLQKSSAVVFLILPFLQWKEKNRLQELRKTVEKDCELKFITTADAIGHETYKRSLCFLLVKAVHDVAGHDKIERVRIHFSVDKGYYCTVDEI